jgi:WD40 repeat protein
MAEGDTRTEHEQRLEEVVLAYLKAVDAGQTPDPDEVIALHPDLADDLRGFFKDLEVVAGAAGNTPMPPPEPFPAGDTVRYFGDYELRGEIARGGMGVVYRARQISLDRPVAVKMILAGQLATAVDVQRFQREAEAVARLDHPNIVSIYEVGEHQGQHFFSMKLVDGGNLNHHLPRYANDERAAARLIAETSRAVLHAHQRGILHRDLKPSNILIDTQGNPHVTDFGLAKQMTALADQPAVDATQSGAIVGTPEYMSPEQARGEKVLTTATDVYSLGAILYALLAGRPPLRGNNLLESLQQVVEQEPEAVRRWNPAVNRDLETVCLKCLAKDPLRRYGSAEALAEDLERWLRHEPITARPVGSVERLTSWCRRNPAVAGLVGTVAAVLLLGTTIATLFAIQAYRNAVTAEKNADDARKETLRAEAGEKDAREQRRLADERLEATRQTLMTAQLHRVASIFEKDPATALDLLLDVRACPLDLRDPAWRFYERYCQRGRLIGHSGTVNSLAFSPDGKTLVTGSGNSLGHDDKIKLWDVATGLELATLKGPTGGALSLAYSPDGKTLASGSGDYNQHGNTNEQPEVKLWDMATRQEIASLKGHTYGVYSLAFSPDGKILASGSRDGTVKLWDVATGLEQVTLKSHGNVVYSLAFSPDGKTLAFASGGELTLWNLATGRERFSIKRNAISLAYHPDGKTLFVGSGREVILCDVTTGREQATLKGVAGVWSLSPDGMTLGSGSWDGVKLLHIATGEEIATFKGHFQSVSSVAFSPDGQTLASGSEDRTVKLWDLAAGQQRATLEGQTKTVHSVASSPDLKTIAWGCKDGTVRVWDLASGHEYATLKGHTGKISHVAYSPDGKILASGCSDGTVKLWELATGQEVAAFRAHTKAVGMIVYSPDGKTVATASTFVDTDNPERKKDNYCRNEMKLWDVATGQSRGTLEGQSASILSLAYSPDGRTLAASLFEFEEEKHSEQELDGETGLLFSIVLFDVAAGEKCAVLSGHTSFLPFLLAYSPDGETLVSATDAFLGPPGDFTLWDLATGHVRAGLNMNSSGLPPIAYSPDGKTLASGSDHRTLKLWDVATGLERATLKGHTGKVVSVTFSPDGKTVASATGDGTVKLWAVATGQERATLKGHMDNVHSVVFRKDGQTLALISSDGAAKLWDVAIGREYASLIGHSEAVWSLGFSPDGKTLATGSRDETVKLWDLATGQERATLKGHRHWVYSVAFSPDGKTLASGSSDKTVKLWDLSTGKERATLKGHKSEVRSVGYSSDGSRLVSRDDSKTTLVWDASTGERVDEPPPPTNPPSRVSPDGSIEVRVPDFERQFAAEAPEQACQIHLLDRHWKEPALPPLFQTDPTWHAEQAALAEKEKQPFAAAFHLGKLADFQPWDSRLRLREAEAWVKAGQNERAALAYVRAQFAGVPAARMP